MRRKKLIIHLVISALVLILIILKVNDLLIYISLTQCSWPLYETKGENQTKVMFISDIHLDTNTLGTVWDNKVREWQMRSAFKYATKLFMPEVIFILGDVFDEGERVDDQTFQSLVYRLKQLFSLENDWTVTDSASVVHIINGNHDIGFHYTMTQKLKSRFDRSFETDSVKLIPIKDINFVTINSITMEGDYCHLCSQAEDKLKEIRFQLCHKNKLCSAGKGPILLTHFPLYRPSDSLCGYELDSTPESLKHIPFIQKWDCLSDNATKLIINTLKPRLVISGHTHYGCVTRHLNNLYEWTVSSFNYRNTYNPTLLLAKITKTNHSISKCVLINEFIFYFIDFKIILFFVFIWRKIFKRKSFQSSLKMC